MAARAQSDPPEVKPQARKRVMGPAHEVRFLYEPTPSGDYFWSGLCTSCRETFTAPTGADMEVLADEHEAYVLAAIAQQDIPTPGCDCDHTGFGKAWHKRTCKWAAAQPADVKPGEKA